MEQWVCRKIHLAVFGYNSFITLAFVRHVFDIIVFSLPSSCCFFPSDLALVANSCVCPAVVRTYIPDTVLECRVRWTAEISKAIESGVGVNADRVN